MLEAVIISFLFAKCKGYKITPALKCCWLFPVYAMELLGLVVQADMFLHTYRFIFLAGILKTIYLVIYLFPIIKFKLWKPAIVGSALIVFGTLLNKIVMRANGGKMPIYPSLTRHTGYFNYDMFMTSDKMHILGDATTKLKFLSDYIDTGYSILSIGDIVIRLFVIIIIYYSIKTINQQNELNKPLYKVKVKT